MNAEAQDMIYVDAAATTRPHESVFEAMCPFLHATFGNPSSAHSLAQQPRIALQASRESLADAIGADASQIVFTNSGSAANNLAIQGIARRHRPEDAHLIASAVEHASVRETLVALGDMGYQVSFVPVDCHGRVDPADVQSRLRPSTVLVSVMYGSNEVGTTQPIDKIGKLCRAEGVPFHCDAVQALGHVPIDLGELPVDMMSFSAHKIHGPKGVGALFVSNANALEPLIYGGGQEHGLWSGTENLPGIAGFGAAAQRIPDLLGHREMLEGLRNTITNRVKRVVDGVMVTGHPTRRLPHIASFAFSRVAGDALVMALDRRGICASTGSACNAGAASPSWVLGAMGLEDELAANSLRISFSVDNDHQQTITIARALSEVVPVLRRK